MNNATTRKAAMMAATMLALGMLSGQVLAKDHEHHGHDDRHGDYDDRHRDHGRHGPPPWARGHDYRKYGYERVVIVPAPEYRRYRLYAPPPGDRWVRDDGGNYLLVSIASGIIGDILTRNGL